MRVPLVTDSIPPLYIFYRPFYILLPLFTPTYLLFAHMYTCTKSYRKVSSIHWTRLQFWVHSHAKVSQGSLCSQPPSGQNGQKVDTFDHLARGWGGLRTRVPLLLVLLEGFMAPPGSSQGGTRTRVPPFPLTVSRGESDLVRPMPRLLPALVHEGHRLFLNRQKLCREDDF